MSDCRKCGAELDEMHRYCPACHADRDASSFDAPSGSVPLATPRTDAAIHLLEDESGVEYQYLPADFGRTLERELAVATESVRMLGLDLDAERKKFFTHPAVIQVHQEREAAIQMRDNLLDAAKLILVPVAGGKWPDIAQFKAFCAAVASAMDKAPNESR